jgi:hypothetical protein
MDQHHSKLHKHLAHVTRALTITTCCMLLKCLRDSVHAPDHTPACHQVMAVLTRLASLNISRQQSAAFEAAGTSPEALVRQMAANSELSTLLSKPSVRQALTRIRTAADPDAELQAAQADPDVKRALDLLEAAVVGGPEDVVVDV